MRLSNKFLIFVNKKRRLSNTGFESMKLYLGLRRTEEDLITHEKSKEQNEIPRRRDDLP